MKGDGITHSRWFYLILQIVVLAVLVLAFWAGYGNDAIGFSVIAIYFVMPVSIFAISYLMAGTVRDLRMLLLSPLYGLCFMLLEYLTFSMANMLSFSRFNFPDIMLLIAGTLISAAAMVISYFTKKKEIKG
jgi:uncharacterized membrane protein